VPGATDELERVLFGELHLVRRRLDATLDTISALARTGVRGEQWEDVEQAARIAYRGSVVRSPRFQPGRMPRRSRARSASVVERRSLGAAAVVGPVELELSPLPRGSPRGLTDRSRGLPIDERTCPSGAGDPMDLEYAVDALLSAAGA
jgi:hypothetical protein